MGRIIGSVFVGYVVMIVAVFATFSVAYLAMGVDRAYQPGSYEASGLWIAVSFVLGFIAAMAGGYVCTAVAQSRKGPRALAWVVIVVGLLMAVGIMMAPKKDAAGRSGEVSAVEAMQKSVAPTWVAFLNPFLGAAGVLIGAGLHPKGSRREV
jgi:hypothetical protein